MLRSPSHVSRNLRKLLKETTKAEWAEGFFWYQNAYIFAETLATGTFSVEQAARLLASLSTQQSWDRTQAMARDFMAGRDVSWKAHPTGPKVESFYQSIRYAGKTAAVCCDRHMACAAAGRKLTKVELHRFFRSPRRRNLIIRQVRRLADEYKVTPAQMQAILWVTWRRMHKGKRAAA